MWIILKKYPYPRWPKSFCTQMYSCLIMWLIYVCVLYINCLLLGAANPFALAKRQNEEDPGKERDSQQVMEKLKTYGKSNGPNLWPAAFQSCRLCRKKTPATCPIKRSPEASFINIFQAWEKLWGSGVCHSPGKSYREKKTNRTGKCVQPWRNWRNQSLTSLL